MQRAPTFAHLIRFCGATLLCGVAAAAMAQAGSAGQPVRGLVRATHAASAGEVRIAPTTMAVNSTSVEESTDAWIARGFDLKTLIAQVYDIDSRRIDFAANGATSGRYDVTMALPAGAGQDAIQQMLLDALEQKFHVTITPEVRAMEVYVLSAPHGPGTELRPHAADDAEQISYAARGCSGVLSSNGISVSAGTISDFGHSLEPDMDRVVVDETHLAGSYDFEIGKYGSKEELFKLLRERLGLVVIPLERKVTVLKVRPQGEFASL